MIYRQRLLSWTKLIVPLLLFSVMYFQDWSKLNPESGAMCVISKEPLPSVFGRSTGDLDHSLATLPIFIRSMRLGFETFDSTNFVGSSRFQEYGYLISGFLSQFGIDSHYTLLWRLLGLMLVLSYGFFVYLTSNESSKPTTLMLLLSATIVSAYLPIAYANRLWGCVFVMPFVCGLMLGGCLKSKRWTFVVFFIATLLLLQSGHPLYMALIMVQACSVVLWIYLERGRSAGESFVNRSLSLYAFGGVFIATLSMLPFIYYQFFDVVFSFKPLIKKTVELSLLQGFLPSIQYANSATIHVGFASAIKVISAGAIPVFLWIALLISLFMSWKDTLLALLLTCLPHFFLASIISVVGDKLPPIFTSVYWGYWTNAATSFSAILCALAIIKNLDSPFSSNRTIPLLLIMSVYLFFALIAHDFSSAILFLAGMTFVLTLRFKRRQKVLVLQILSVCSISISTLSQPLPQIINAFKGSSILDRQIDVVEQKLSQLRNGDMPLRAEISAEIVSQRPQCKGYGSYFSIPYLGGGWLSAFNVVSTEGVSDTHRIELALTYSNYCWDSVFSKHPPPGFYPMRMWLCKRGEQLARHYQIENKISLDKLNQTATLDGSLSESRLYPNMLVSSISITSVTNLSGEMKLLSDQNLSDSIISGPQKLTVIKNSDNQFEEAKIGFIADLLIKLENSTFHSKAIETDLEPGDGAWTLESWTNTTRVWKGGCRGSGCIVRVYENFDPRWKLTVNGKKAKFFRSDVGLIAFLAPEGPSKIELTWQPRFLYRL